MNRGRSAARATGVPTVVSSGERKVPAELQTAQMRREQAFTGDDRWVGYVRSEPGGWSGWHHHGDHDTYFYVLQGNLQLEHGEGHALTDAGAGDFVHVPAGLTHRERSTGDDPAEVVLVRMGRGPTVVNVSAPPT